MLHCLDRKCFGQLDNARLLYSTRIHSFSSLHTAASGVKLYNVLTCIAAGLSSAGVHMRYLACSAFFRVFQSYLSLMCCDSWRSLTLLQNAVVDQTTLLTRCTCSGNMLRSHQR